MTGDAPDQHRIDVSVERWQDATVYRATCSCGTYRSGPRARQVDAERDGARHTERIKSQSWRKVITARDRDWRGRVPEWREIAEDLALRLQAHAQCPTHPITDPCEGCRPCEDRAAVERWRQRAGISPEVRYRFRPGPKTFT